ncbi:MAG TPA: MFS transporter [Acidobacteriota bacterium]|nr:MFS transporter [Acidobacteriota bacterium]HRR26066.1 MFS transporter [Acidobacteriota bacterium]HRV07797.1 MFS transporter [Acidobacteriota bacterium]
MEQQGNRLAAVVALMAVFSLAVCFIIIGAISEELKAGIGIDNAQLGSLVLALFLTSMIVQLIIGPLVDKFGHRPLAIVGFLVTSVALFILASASSMSVALPACVLLGIGAMALNTVGNTLIPVVLFDGRDPARASNFGNAFFGLGYVLTPLIFSLFGRWDIGYRTGVSILGILVLVFLVVSLLARYPQVSTGYEFSMAIRLLKEGAVLMAALALFCYVALETSMGTWIKPYMTDVFGGASAPGAVSNAGLVLTLFGVAMMVGRFLTSAVKNLTTIGTKIIAGAAVVSVVSLILMVLTPTPAVASLAVVVTGLAFAPIFPTVVGVTFSKYEPRLYGSIFGIIFAVGLLGGTLVPKIIGNLSAAATAEQFSPDALWIAVVMAAVLFFLALALGRVGTRKA